MCWPLVHVWLCTYACVQCACVVRKLICLRYCLLPVCSEEQNELSPGHWLKKWFFFLFFKFCMQKSIWMAYCVCARARIHARNHEIVFIHCCFSNSICEQFDLSPQNTKIRFSCFSSFPLFYVTKLFLMKWNVFCSSDIVAAVAWKYFIFFSRKSDNAF